MARGGRRAGKPQTAYSNRTDLSGAKPKLAVVTPHSSVYGQGAELEAAQQAVPMGDPSAPATAPAAPQPPAMPAMLPGQLPALHGPTQRPDEPVTTGLPTGPGAGPEVLGGFAPATGAGPHTVANTIEQLSAGDMSGELAALFQFAQARGL